MHSMPLHDAHSLSLSLYVLCVSFDFTRVFKGNQWDVRKLTAYDYIGDLGVNTDRVPKKFAETGPPKTKGTCSCREFAPLEGDPKVEILSMTQYMMYNIHTSLDSSRYSFCG